jgi:uncharacterized protein YwgA
MDRKDWTLLAISAGDQPLTPVQLQKTLFVLGRKREEEVGEDYYDFIAYDYGPFSKDIYSDAEHLAQKGAVSISRTGRRRRFNLTNAGRERARRVRDEAPDEAVEYLEKFVGWAQDQTFADLLNAVYNAYPRYAKNSVFDQS